MNNCMVSETLNPKKIVSKPHYDVICPKMTIKKGRHAVILKLSQIHPKITCGDFCVCTNIFGARSVVKAFQLIYKIYWEP